MLLGAAFRKGGTSVLICQHAFKLAAGREDETVGAVRAGELDRRWKSVLGRTARKREGRPAEAVEGIGEGDDALADVEVVHLDGRSDAREGRSENEVDAGYCLGDALAVLLERA